MNTLKTSLGELEPLDRIKMIIEPSKFVLPAFKTIDWKDIVNDLGWDMNEKWMELKDSMIELTGTELIPKKDYISLCSEDSSHKTIAYFNFQKNAIRMDFNVGNIYTDGSKSKGFFILDDPKKVSSLRTWEWKNGVIGNVYKVPISNETDIDYVMFLLKQKYKNLRNSTN